MLAAAGLCAIAHQIKTAQDQSLPLTQMTKQHAGFDAAAADAVADLIHAMRLADGARAVGRKIGVTNPAWRSRRCCHVTGSCKRQAWARAWWATRWQPSCT